MGAILRKYATGTGADIYIPLIKADSMDFADDGDWTPVAGDVKISIDGASQNNINTLPVYTDGRWKFVFTNGELTGKQISINIVDSATKAIEDDAIIIETYGNTLAQHVFDLSKSFSDSW